QRRGGEQAGGQGAVQQAARGQARQRILILLHGNPLPRDSARRVVWNWSESKMQKSSGWVTRVRRDQAMRGLRGALEARTISSGTIPEVDGAVGFASSAGRESWSISSCRARAPSPAMPTCIVVSAGCT